MASPVSDSYSVVSGVIRGGRYLLQGDRRISIWGQSNAVGRAQQSDLSASPLSSDSELATYNAGVFDRVYIWTGSVYEKLEPEVNNLTEENQHQFGPEFGLAVRWTRESGAGNLYIDKHAIGGVSIDYFYPSTTFYDDGISARSLADAWLVENNITVTDDGWLWEQGESDYTQSQSWYQSRLEGLISDLETDGYLLAGTKRLLVQMHPDTDLYGAGVYAAKTAVAASSTSNTLAYDAPNYMKVDNYHQNGQGQVQLGYDAFERIFGMPHINT